MNLTSTPAEISSSLLEPSARRIRIGARIFLSRFFVAGVVVALLLGRSHWAETGARTPALMMLVGLSLATFAMAGRLWCSLFIAGRKNAELVTHGPYALCRNPLYFFSFIGALGVGLASGMFTIVLTVAVAFALYYPVVIRREEAYLYRRHGEDFTAYMKAVPSFWPRGWNRLEAFPESTLCHSRIFINHLASAVWFPIGCGVVHVLSLFHNADFACFVLP